jgi:autotransporter-associated beta strand protein
LTGGGILEIPSSGAIGGTGASSGNLTLDNGTFRNTSNAVGGTFLTGNRGLIIGPGGGTIDLPGGSVIIYTSGSITGAGNTVTKTGSGTFRYTTPTSTTFSKLVVKGGLWQGATDTVFGAVPGAVTADAITLDGGGISSNAGQNLSANRGITITAAGGTINTSSQITVQGVVTGVGSLTKTGTSLTSTLDLTGANTFTGGFNFTQGHRSCGHQHRVGRGQLRGHDFGRSDPFLHQRHRPNPDLTRGRSTTTSRSGKAPAAPRLLRSRAPWIWAARRRSFPLANAADTISAAISNGGLNIPNSGTSILTLSGNSTYTGTTTVVSGGILKIQTNANALGATSAGTTVNSGGQLQTATALNYPEPITLNGTGANNDNTGALLVTANGPTFSGGITIGSSGVRMVNSGATAVVSGGITGNNTNLSMGGAQGWTINTNPINIGNGTFTYDGTVALRLDTANTMGAFNYNSGIVKFNTDTAAGTGIITVGASATEFSVTGGSSRSWPTTSCSAPGATCSFYAASGGSLTLNGTISGTGAAQRRETGAVNPVINGANTFSGGFTVTSRGVTLGNKSALGTGTFNIGESATAPQTTIVIASNTDLTGLNAVANNVSVTQPFTIGGTTGLELSGPVTLSNLSPTITVTSSAPGILSGTISGAFGITKAGSGALTLKGANTYTGTTTVSAGRLAVNNITGSGTGSGNVSVTGSGVLGGTGSIAGGVTIDSGGKLAPGNSIGTITVGALTLNTGSVLDYEVGAPNSSDTTIVTTPSTGLTLNSGTINITDAGGLGIGTYTLIDYDTAFVGSLSNLALGTTPGGTFNYSLFNDTGATAIDLVVSPLEAASATWNVDASGSWSTFSNWTPGIPSGVDAVANFGGVITADRTVTLDTPRTVGTLNFNNAGASYTIAGNQLTMQVTSGLAFLNVAAGNHTIAADVAMNSNTDVDTAGGTSLSLNGVLSGSGTLFKTSPGTLFLNNSANTYTGATNLGAGVTSIGSAGALGNTSVVAFTGGTLRTTANLSVGAPVTLDGAGGTVDTDVNTVTLGGAISGTGDLTKISSGTLALSNSANSYSGATNVNAGTLAVTAAGALGNTSAINLTSSTLKTAADMSIAAQVTLAGTGATVDTDPSNVTFAGAVSGSGSLTKVNAGSLTLANSSNSYSGGSIVNGGSLISGADNALGTGNVTVNTGTLDVGATNNTVGAVSLVDGSINGSTGVLAGTSFAVQNGSIGAILGGSGAADQVRHRQRPRSAARTRTAAGPTSTPARWRWARTACCPRAARSRSTAGCSTSGRPSSRPAPSPSSTARSPAAGCSTAAPSTCRTAQSARRSAEPPP